MVVGYRRRALSTTYSSRYKALDITSIIFTPQTTRFTNICCPLLSIMRHTTIRPEKSLDSGQTSTEWLRLHSFYKRQSGGRQSKHRDHLRRSRNNEGCTHVSCQRVEVSAHTFVIPPRASLHVLIKCAPKHVGSTVIFTEFTTLIYLRCIFLFLSFSLVSLSPHFAPHADTTLPLQKSFTPTVIFSQSMTGRRS